MTVLDHADPEVADIAARTQAAIDKAVADGDWVALDRIDAQLRRIADEPTEAGAR